MRRPQRSAIHLHVLLAVAVAVSVSACPAAPRTLPWEVRISDPALRGRVRAVTATVHEGGCDGTELWSLSYRPSMPPDARPPELGPGLHAFEVVAYDAACGEIARGCEEAMLPLAGGSAVTVDLSASSAAAECAATQCTDGLCAGADAGTDASVDGGRTDGGGAPDASFVCPTGRTDCNYLAADGCETTLTSVTDCGACARPCELPHASATCATGSCAIEECLPGWGDCNMAAADGCEVSLETTNDCRSCGAACSLPHAVAVCGAGGCEIGSCHAGWGDCNAVAADGCEAALTDASSCGACGTVCADATPLCGLDAMGARACVALCEATAPTTCGASCVDTTTAVSDCGMCDQACAQPHASMRCEASACVRAACDEGWQDCDGLPTNGCERSTRTATDCGGCGVVCASPEATCASGACEVERCAPGRLDCDASGTTGCETDGTTTTDCGACGTQCAGGTPVCAPTEGGFACAASCPATAPEACSGSCLDTDTDVSSCGMCGNACVLPGASAICRGGLCRVQTCEAGRADCNGDPADGCEATLDSDAEHCGRCGNACPSGPGATAVCAAGSCAIRCEAGLGDCDGVASTGCERSLRTLTDCGGCGDGCAPPGGSGDCSSGSCALTGCDTNFGNCDGTAANGCEVDLRTNRRHCGMCDMNCVGMMGSCCNGMCAADCP